MKTLLGVARELAKCGHHPVLVLRNIVEPMALLRDESFPVLQAPFWHHRPPPADMPAFPPLLNNVQPLVPQERILDVVQAVQRQRGRPAPETLPGLLVTAGRFIRTLPELDPYNPMRREPLVGPIGPLPPLLTCSRATTLFRLPGGRFSQGGHARRESRRVWHCRNRLRSRCSAGAVGDGPPARIGDV